jgi:protein TonB
MPVGGLGAVAGGQGDAPVAAGKLASPPRLIRRVLPLYPPSARTQRIEGQVLLRAIVDQQGEVEDAITVVRSVPTLDEAAIAALRQWRFTPGRDASGNTVRVILEVPIRFQLR